MDYPNEILYVILDILSDEFIGYVRVCKRFYAIAQAIKLKRCEAVVGVKIGYLERFKLKHIRFSPFLIYSELHFTRVFACACRVNNKYVINHHLRIKKFELNYDIALEEASYGNHLELVEMCLEKFGHREDGSYGAAAGGHLELLLTLADACTDWNVIMCYAAEGNQMKIIEYCIEKDANDWDHTMCFAARGGYKEIVDFCILRGADNWEKARFFAIEGLQRDLALFFHAKLHSATL